MTSLNVCFSNYSVKSQPEVGLSQDLFDFTQLEHDYNTIPIPSNALFVNETDVGPEYASSSFGSFSSAADSLVHDNAIVIPAYNPPSTPSVQDFCLLDSQQDPSLALLSSSGCESDISFCSPTTPLSTMLSPYGFSMDDMTPVTSPGTWLANTMQQGLSLQSPEQSLYSPTYMYSTPSQQDMGDLKVEQKTPKKTARRREYTCPYCPRKSNRSNNMKEHILTHDPNRPKNFSCSICPKRFARKHDLKRHHQSHERNIEKMMVACGLMPRAFSLE